MGFVKDAWNSITGKSAAKAAEKSGQLQYDASMKAAEMQQKQYEQSRADMQPWMEAGKSALGKLQNYVDNNNKPYNDQWGNRIENAYTHGQLTGGMTPEQFYQDPSYAWRKQEGLDKIQAQAAASGGLFSGAAGKALADYNSNLASQEYQNAWARDQAQKNQLWGVLNGARSQDYNLWNGERSRNYNEMANLAGVGQSTANTLASLGANNANQVGDAYTSGANAKANAVSTGAYAKSQGMGNLLGLGAKVFGLF